MKSNLSPTTEPSKILYKSSGKINAAWNSFNYESPYRILLCSFSVTLSLARAFSQSLAHADNAEAEVNVSSLHPFTKLKQRAPSCICKTWMLCGNSLVIKIVLDHCVHHV